jgi:hypothetical protein
MITNAIHAYRSVYRNFVATALIAIGALGMTWGSDAQASGSISYAFIAGQNQVAGTITISADLNNLYVTYTMAPGWLLTQAHMDIAPEFSMIPQSKTGNPKPGQFAYVQGFAGGTKSCTFTVPGNTLTPTLFAPGFYFENIAAHGVVQQIGGGTQSGWGGMIGDLGVHPFPGANWSTYMVVFFDVTGNVLPPDLNK